VQGRGRAVLHETRGVRRPLRHEGGHRGGITLLDQVGGDRPELEQPLVPGGDPPRPVDRQDSIAGRGEDRTQQQVTLAHRIHRGSDIPLAGDAVVDRSLHRNWTWYAAGRCLCGRRAAKSPEWLPKLCEIDVLAASCGGSEKVRTTIGRGRAGVAVPLARNCPGGYLSTRKRRRRPNPRGSRRQASTSSFTLRLAVRSAAYE